jgi:curved DNA-binding protein CbpA
MKSFRQFLKEQMTPKEAEAILGLSSGYDANEVQKAYKYQARINHPDRGGDPEKMKLVNQAYAVLKGKSSALDRQKDAEQRRQEYDRRATEIRDVMQAAIRKAFKPTAFIKHFETHMGGEKFTWTERTDMTKVRTSFKWAGFRGEFRGNQGSVFEFDVTANPQDAMGGSGLGSTLSNISFPLSTVSYGFVNNRKVKMFQRDWGSTRTHDVLFKPEIAFPPKSLQRKESAASRPLKRSDMVTGLAKKANAKAIGDMWMIPLKDGSFVGISRTVFMRTPAWTVYDVYDKSGEFSYKPRRLGLYLTLPEDDATLDFFGSLTKMDARAAIDAIKKLKESRK